MNIPELLAKLVMEDEAGRMNAAEDLGYANAPEAILPLVELLAAERSRKVRETIFLALERMAGPEVLDRVATLLDSEDAFLRNQAVGLLQRKGPASAPVLLVRMRDADPDVRKFVVDAAADISAAAIEPIYEAAIRDPDPNVVIAALEHVGEQRHRRFKPAVEEIFTKAAEPMLVGAAFATLLQIGDAASWECIGRRYPTAASVPNWELSWWIRALGEFGPAGEIEVFHELLGRHDGNVAPDVIDALERFQLRHGRVAITGDFWTILRELIPALTAPEDKLQLLRVLGGFGAPAAIGDYLAELLEQGDRMTKLGAIEGLKRLARPDLLARLRDRRGLEPDAEIAEAMGECP
jgi:hypothetical protein